MTYCYTPMPRPDFFYVDGDCLSTNHDLKSSNGGLGQNTSSIISAILIQLNTDGRVADERGWWGNQFERYEIGNRLWAVIDSPSQTGVTARAEEAIRTALQPLISQDVIDKVEVRVVKTITGIEATVSAVKAGESIFKTKIS